MLPYNVFYYRVADYWKEKEEGEKDAFKEKQINCLDEALL